MKHTRYIFIFMTAIFCMGMFRTCSTSMEITPCDVLNHTTQKEIMWFLLKKKNSEGLGIRFTGKTNVLFMLKNEFVLVNVKTRMVTQTLELDKLNTCCSKILDIPSASNNSGYDLFLNIDNIFCDNPLLEFVLIDDGFKGFVMYKNQSDFINYDASICDLLDYKLIRQSSDFSKISSSPEVQKNQR